VTQLVLPLETRPAFGRDDFIVAPANREAVAFIDAFPDWPTSIAALHGPEGSGKSHLAAAWAARARAHIVEASSLDEKILHDNASALVVENVDGSAPGAERDSILLALVERGRAMLLTGRSLPSQWQTAIPDLASRYRAVVSFALWAPDDLLLGAMARKLFADEQLTVPDAVIDYMIRSLERSPAAIRDAVVRADAKALAEKRPVTVALMREILAERQGTLL
jgi:chromosomal replication initiation ATPase DnaA